MHLGLFSSRSYRIQNIPLAEDSCPDTRYLFVPSRLMDQPAWQPRVICPPSPTECKTAASLQRVAEGGLGGEWLQIPDQ